MPYYFLPFFLVFFFPLGFKPGYFLYTAAFIPAGRGALWASFIADFARASVLIGKLPAGAPPEGPAKAFTPLYFPTLEPPAFLRAAACFLAFAFFHNLYLYIVIKKASLSTRFFIVNKKLLG